ncbi:M15 family metallopeptidase [Motilibacter sp. E257]|uniref:M15 family metallopeptidase n=1 Tax=Motilibacter deserti TaxID=2714956 RepID=A0ABX0H0E8_9ACTN|nr:M15 family metallopeptidase [Motilibacter deserti]
MSLLVASTAALASIAQAAPAAPARGELPAYTSKVSRIDNATLARMRYSHRAGCPVKVKDLRLVRLTYYGFDAKAHTGELVVAAAVAGDVTAAFGRLYEARFPIARMVLVDNYKGSDARSMAANNTSAYNCRKVAGTSRWSEHSYGRAVDINPVQNPYVQGRSVAPAAGRAYVDRSQDVPGLIRAKDAVVKAFAVEGWGWGGIWRASKDYQHFSSTGR